MAKEYIEREAALDIAMQYCPDDDGSCSKAGADLREMLDEIEDIPAADVVPVVRCKDCRYAYDSVGGWCCSYGICVDCVVREDFFCADGARMDKDSDGNVRSNDVPGYRGRVHGAVQDG